MDINKALDDLECSAFGIIKQHAESIHDVRNVMFHVDTAMRAVNRAYLKLDKAADALNTESERMQSRPVYLRG